MDFKTLKGKFTKQDARMLNPLTLAFIGDAVYEVYIRTYLVDKNRESSVNKLHIKAISYVKAKAQSCIMKNLMDDLNDEEFYIFKRGRNAKSNTIPKNADVIDYKIATGFEALIGYLYLIEEDERLNEILEFSLNHNKENNIQKGE